LGVSLEVLSLVGLMNVHAWPWVIFWVALLGVGTATHWPSVVTGTRRLSHEDSRAQSMSLVFVAWLVGSGLGPIAVNFLMGGRDRTAFLMLVAADLVALGLTFVAKHPVLHSRLRRWPREGQWLSRLWPFRFILPGMFMQNLTLGILLPVLEPYLVRVLAFSQVAFSELIAGGGAMTIVLLWPMGRLTDRFGLRFPLIGGFFIAGAALVGVVSTRQFMGLIVWGGLLGSAYAMILPSWNAFLARLVPFSVEGSVWGLLMTVEGFGMAVGPILGTRLFEVAPWLPFGFAGVILAMMGAFYWLFPLERLSA
jgi:MFS family permease